MPSGTAALLLAAALGASSCGVFMVRRPPARVRRDVPPDCTQSTVAPTIDQALAIASVPIALVLGVLAIRAERDPEEGTNEFAVATGLTVVGGGVLASTAIIGKIRVKGCRQAVAVWHRLQADQ